MGTGEYLVCSASGPVHRQAFAAQFIGQPEGGGNVPGGRGRWKIDRFGYSAVTVSLKDGLHPDMMGRSNIVGGHK